MIVNLLRYTDDPEVLSGLAAAICYDSADYDKALKGAMSSGHESILEHVSFTFLIDGVSRALLAQLTRHRIASFSVQSQRYVDLGAQFNYVIPPSIQALGEEDVKRYQTQMAMMHGWYKEWQSKLGKGEKSNEDARFVLPNACTTKIVMTMNARELRHFFALRCCWRAQWEIRNMAREMLRQCRKVAPRLFEDAGPECLRKGCPEGKRSCRKPWNF